MYLDLPALGTLGPAHAATPAADAPPADWQRPIEKIGEGKYREVYRCEDSVVKLLKAYRVKQNWLGTYQVSTETYVRNSFGVEDFNLLELENYRRLIDLVPADFRKMFVRIHWAGRFRGRSASVSDLVRNDDGTPARPLGQFQKMQVPDFWRALAQMESLLNDTRLFFTDITPENILVKFQDGVPTPVFVDYKRLGAETYPCQFWLASDTALRIKMRRKFHAIRRRHGQE